MGTVGPLRPDRAELGNHQEHREVQAAWDGGSMATPEARLPGPDSLTPFSGASALGPEGRRTSILGVRSGMEGRGMAFQMTGRGA